MQECFINRDRHLFFSLGWCLNQSTQTFACRACIIQVWAGYSSVQSLTVLWVRFVRQTDPARKDFDNTRMQWPCCFNWGNLCSEEKTVGVRGFVNRLFFTLLLSLSTIFRLLIIFFPYCSLKRSKQMKRRAER